MLGKPLELGCGVSLSNRIAKAAMTECLADLKNRATDGLERLYRVWGRSGAALLMSGNVMVDGRYLEHPRNIVLEDDRGLDELRRVAEAGRAEGAELWMQINHPGRQTQRLIASRPVAPSAVGAVKMFKAFARPRALEAREIREIVQRFARTAALAKEAGFTGVQVHGAHGYLISQFLSPLTNHRADEWGGSLENRARFLLEVVQAVRKSVGMGFPVSVKLNSADFQRGGFSEEDSMQVLEMLDGEGVDLLEVSGGNYESLATLGLNRERRTSRAKREVYFLEYAEKVRMVTKMALMVTGGFRSRRVMEEALKSGALDVIGVARPLALDPSLPRRWVSGEVDRYEGEPGRLRYRKLAAIAELGYYVRQIHRLADGQNPRPRMRLLSSALCHLGSEFWGAFRWRQGHKR